MPSEKRDIIIIGSGPAGYSAAIYAARAGMNPLMIQGIQPGGQLMITTDVENYPGFEAVQGPHLMSQMERQAKKSGAEISFDHVIAVDFSETKNFKITCSSEKIYFTKTCVIATGAQAKWLGLPSEEEYMGHGVSGCAVCDGMFFKNQTVVVAGGGNTAVEEALYLSKIASKVILVHRRNQLRAERVLQSRVLSSKNIEIIWDHVIGKIIGNQNPKIVTAVEIKHVKTNAVSVIQTAAVFVAIGHEPATKIFVNQVETDRFGYIKTRPGTVSTNIPGVFAAGDVQDPRYRQAVTAAGTGCMAALEAQWYLEGA